MFANFIFAARHWIYYLQICIFAAGCCIVWHTMFHCLPIYINFCHGQRTVSIFYTFAARYWILCEFTFLPLRWLLHWLCIYITVSIFVCVFTFLPLVVALIVHLHFCRLFVCIDNKFTFFAAHCCILCTFRFCHLLLQLHCLCIYILPFFLYWLKIYNFVSCCCIVYKFTFLPLAVALFTYLHFAACFFIAYVFFLFCKFCFKVY